MHLTHRPSARLGVLLSLAWSAAACGGAASATTTAPTPAPAPTAPTPAPAGPRTLVTPPVTESLGQHRIVPAPAAVFAGSGAAFVLDTATTIVAPAGGDGERVGRMLAMLLRPSTGLRVPVSTAAPASRNAIVLRLGGSADLGGEGYEMVVNADSVRITAPTAAGLFHGVQTLRQLLPAGVEAEQADMRMASAWSVPAGRIVDRPRLAWRGMMLDVARHFFTVDEVKQVIDILALYKLNTLHLHLADDQGWRIQIDSWPKLATVGGATEVGGGEGGYYTKADYAAIVRYAADRFVTIVPEIDMPAHSNAAIAAYPELGCSRPVPKTAVEPPLPGLYPGISVGWSALCPDSARVFQFVDDVTRELAAMTPGAYLHMGGDEVQVLTQAQYNGFVEKVQDIVYKNGKTMVGWDEIGHARLRPQTIAQMWRPDTTLAAVKQGSKLLISAAPRAYLDMKYTNATELGLRWAGFIELRTSYDWDPVTYFPGVTEANVVGVEAPLWSETVANVTAAEQLILPRLPAIAEAAWTPQAQRSWDSFAWRIAGHAPRWRLLGMNFFPSPQVNWPIDAALPQPAAMVP